MTKSLKFLTASLVATVGLCFVALESDAAVPAPCDDGGGGVIAECFLANRNVGILGHEAEQLSSAGSGTGRIRPLKSNQNAAILDFDAVAMQSFIDANSGSTLTWSLNVQVSDGVSANTGDMHVFTVESTNDWTVSDGDGNGGALNWTTGSSATYFYAQTFESSPGVLDTGASLEWIDPDSGPYTFTQRNPDYVAWGVPNTVGGGTATTAADPTPEFTNTAFYTGLDLLTSFGTGSYATVELDNNIVDAILNDVNNRGLRFGPLVNTQSDNMRIFSIDQQGGLFSPYLSVSVAAGQAGDFDGDLDVDGEDLLIWQRGFGTTHDAQDLVDWENNYGVSPAVGAGVGVGVPEPSSLLLLTIGSTMLWRRRSNRSSM